jgi:serine/threonine protein kinase
MSELLNAFGNTAFSNISSSNTAKTLSKRFKPLFTNTNRNRNTIKYREIKTKTKFIINNNNNNSNKLTKKCKLNYKVFKKHSKLQQDLYSNSSNTIIHFITEKKFPYKSYVIKEFKYDDKNKNKTFNLYRLHNEILFYEQIINNFVSNNITPYVLMSAEAYICGLDAYLITETANEEDYQVMTLFDFYNTLYEFITSEIMLNILFQIIYTLKCFNAINFIHQDLHLDNILIFINKKKNILHDNWSLDSVYKFILSNDTDGIFYLPNIGLQIRIFDFDMSIKYMSYSKINELNFERLIIKKYDNTITYTNQKNPYLDTITVLSIIYRIFSSVYLTFKKKFDHNVNDELLNILQILLNYIPITPELQSQDQTLFTFYYHNVTQNIKSNILNLHNAFILGEYTNMFGNLVILSDKTLLPLFKSELKTRFLTRDRKAYIPNDKELLTTNEYLNYLILCMKNIPYYNELETYEIIDTFNFTNLFENIKQI